MSDNTSLKLKEFESLSESAKAEIETAFNEAVEIKAEALAAEKISEAVELEKVKLTEEFEAAKDEMSKLVVESMDEFLEEQLDKFAEVVSNRLDEAVINEKSKAILDIFNSMIEVAGVDVLNLYESASINSADKRDEWLSKKYDELTEKYSKVRSELEELKIQNLINEKASELNLVSAEKFKVLANLLEKDENFELKLSEIVESLKSSEGDVNNTKQEPRIDESATRENAFSARHVKNNGSYIKRDLSDIDASKF